MNAELSPINKYITVRSMHGFFAATALPLSPDGFLPRTPRRSVHDTVENLKSMIANENEIQALPWRAPPTDNPGQFDAPKGSGVNNSPGKQREWNRKKKYLMREREEMDELVRYVLADETLVRSSMPCAVACTLQNSSLNYRLWSYTLEIAPRRNTSKQILRILVKWQRLERRFPSRFVICSSEPLLVFNVNKNSK